MRDYICEYHVKLITKGPVFIGNGQEYNKKEYLFDRKQGKVLIPDQYGFYSFLKQRRLLPGYESYMLDEKSRDLLNWVLTNQVTFKEMEHWIAYTLDCGDAILEKGRGFQVLQCIKDAYHRPYIPGSSLKGMLRTILLSDLILQEPERFRWYSKKMKEASHRRGDRNIFSREMKDIEVEAFNVLNLNVEKKRDMVNDCLSGLIISDSDPVSNQCLSLFQKVEYHVDGTETRLPILREGIAPDTEISFTITIDQTRCSYSVDKIQKAIEHFSENYYRFFLRKYPGTDRPKPGTVWLGGGSGYVSKTINYPLFQNEGIEMAMTVFENTIPDRQKKEHKHYLDDKKGVSPHILKCTVYKGQRLQFGECQLQFE